MTGSLRWETIAGLVVWAANFAMLWWIGNRVKHEAQAASVPVLKWMGEWVDRRVKR